jgi:putative tryptophan/tyrosine transport system substrate-binding protein
MAEQGGLVGYGPRITELFLVLGRQLVKMLRGANPCDIPVEQLSRFELVVNLQAAKKIGLEFSFTCAPTVDRVNVAVWCEGNIGQNTDVN